MTEEDKIHYFDWAATSPSDSDILHKALDETITVWGNPSSIHRAGAEAKEALNKARERCAAVLGVKAEKLVFTSGGTESDHIPLLAMLERPAPGTILISALEHPALREQAAAMAHCGWNIVTIPSDADGFITPEAVLDHLTDDTVLVCVMAVNNETGAVQPFYKISDALTSACKGKRRPKFHVDCVQAAGKIPLNLSYQGIDSAAFSAHKICGPRGIGLLYLKDDITPFLRGGGQEKNIRSGTENLFGATAFSYCLERYFITAKNPQTEGRFKEQKIWAADFIRSIAALKNCTIIPHSRLHTAEEFSPWVIQASFAGIPGQVMVRALSAKGYFISTGSACSAKKQSRPILEAMHIQEAERETAVRFSFGPHTTQQAINDLAAAVAEVCSTFCH